MKNCTRIDFEKINIGIIGLGLMGASFALALRNIFQNCYISGFDTNHEHSQKALDLKIVDAVVKKDQELFDKNLVILAVPVEAIVKIVSNITDIPNSTTIIDLGSTKKPIIDAFPDEFRKAFIPAHPMAGTEKSGPEAAFQDIFKDKVMVVCDIEESGELQRSMSDKIFRLMKMKVVHMNADEHDKCAATISHLPHAISFSIANSIMKQEHPEAITALAGGGFRDITRIAKTPPDMWIDIFAQNREHVLKSIAEFKKELELCEAMIIKNAQAELRTWIENANSLHDIL